MAKKTKSKTTSTPSRTKSAKHAKGESKRWVRGVKTVSTFPPKDIFKKDAETIAKTMASKKVSPKGLGSAIRMVQYFINRGGKGLSVARKQELEKAKHLLQERSHRQQNSKKSSPKASHKASSH